MKRVRLHILLDVLQTYASLHELILTALLMKIQLFWDVFNLHQHCFVYL